MGPVWEGGTRGPAGFPAPGGGGGGLANLPFGRQREGGKGGDAKTSGRRVGEIEGWGGFLNESGGGKDRGPNPGAQRGGGRPPLAPPKPKGGGKFWAPKKKGRRNFFFF